MNKIKGDKEEEIEPLEEFEQFLMDSEIHKFYSIEAYIDDDDLCGIENDIYYYILKYKCLSYKELKYLLKMEMRDFRDNLNKLYDYGIINKKPYGRSFRYFYGNDIFQIRKEYLKSLLKKSIELKLSKLEVYQLLRNKKICFDMHIVNDCLKEIDYNIIIDYEFKLANDIEGTYYKKKFIIGLPKIKNYIAKLELSEDILKDACNIYTISLKENLLQGRSIISLAAASVYLSSKVNKSPIVMKDLLKIDDLNQQSVMRVFKLLARVVLPQINKQIQQISAEQYVSKFCTDLELTYQCEKTAMDFIRAMRNKGANLTGKDPKGIASALIYLSTKLHNQFRTQKKITQIAKVTEVTLRNRATEIRKKLNLAI